jgi:hypothetical protein
VTVTVGRIKLGGWPAGPWGLVLVSVVVIVVVKDSVVDDFVVVIKVLGVADENETGHTL